MRHVTDEDMVAKAGREGYAIAAVNVSNMETAAAVLQAASILDAPVLLQVSPVQQSVQGFSWRRMVKVIQAVAEDYPRGRYMIHLDHSECEKECFCAAEAGFDSVMLDGAALPFEENIAAAARVRRRTEKPLEGELGIVGGGEGGVCGQEAKFTDPARVAEFVEKTGIDWLAVAIGNAHGRYLGQPRLDFSVLASIRKETGIPLVLHGASGIPYGDLKKAIGLGISKVNFFTELDLAFQMGWEEKKAAGGYMMGKAACAQEAMMLKAMEVIRVCTGI